MILAIKVSMILSLEGSKLHPGLQIFRSGVVSFHPTDRVVYFCVIRSVFSSLFFMSDICCQISLSKC